MSWDGFVAESKAFMGYGTAMPRWRFWLALPVAWVRFLWLGRRDR